MENKDYYKEKARRRSQELRPKLRAYVNRVKVFLGCKDCGYKENPVALQFDHITGEKTMEISRMVNSCHSLNKIKEEMRKCEVRCANCHAVVTHQRRKE